MKPIQFLDQWTVKHLDDPGEGMPVTLPDDAMLREPRAEDALGGLNISWFEGADYLYERKLTLTEAEAARHTVLEFEGVYRRAEVIINGEKAAQRPYGYTNFFVECDGLLAPGENTVQVIARNADQPNSRWYTGSGIYRPVTLWTAGKDYIPANGVKIRTLSLHPALIDVQVQTSGEGPVRVEILRDKEVVASSEGEERSFCLEIPKAQPWSPECPALYTARVTYGGDEAVETFGLRTLSWGKEGLLLNGERVILRGACIHHDNGLLGAKTYPDAEERRVRILKENGYNAIRSAHNPISKALLNACDRQGMLVMDEYIDHWYIHKTQYDYVDDFDAFWRQDMRDMVDKDFNHPCVILYSIGNEVAETAQKKGIQLTQDMTEFLHDLDCSRPVTCGINIFFNFLNAIGFGQYSDEKAKKEAERNAQARAEGKKTKERATGSKFFNDLAGLTGAGFMKTGATLHGSDVHTREAFARLDIAGYNYGEKRYKKDLKKYPDRLILGSETFCFDAYKFWNLAIREPRLIGDFVWSGMDYLGEVGIGAWEYPDYAPRSDSGLGWITSGSGRIDLTGKPLGEALYTRVAFNLEKGPYIAVRPMGHKGKHSPSAWKMTNAMPSWSWQGHEGENAIVEVYARAAKVELFVNGQSKGVKKSKNTGVFVFKTPFEAGVLEAVAYDGENREMGRRSLKSADGETVLLAVPEENAVRPGHLCYIRLLYADPQGTVKPLERGAVQVTVEGGRLLGLGSACPFYPRSYLSDTADTYYGEVLAIVLADEDSQQMILRATDGTLSAEAAVVIGEAPETPAPAEEPAAAEEPEADEPQAEELTEEEAEVPAPAEEAAAAEEPEAEEPQAEELVEEEEPEVPTSVEEAEAVEEPEADEPQAEELPEEEAETHAPAEEPKADEKLLPQEPPIEKAAVKKARKNKKA